MHNELTTIMPTEIYQALKGESARYKNSFTEKAMADNSIDSYKSDWEDFCIWCNQNNRQFMPANYCDVADYLEDRATNPWLGISGKGRRLIEKQPLKWNSLDRRLTAITKTHQYNGYAFSRKDPAIKRTLEGIKRTFSKEQSHRIIENRKSPILMDDVRKMVDTLPDSLQGKRDRALLLIGFVGALRRSELAGIDKAHLTLTKEGFLLLLPWSKTGKREVVIPYGSNLSTCPVRSLQEWINAAEIKSGPIFRGINRHGHIQPCALTDKAVALIINRNQHIRDAIQSAKVKKSQDSTVTVPNFGGHSLRAGFVTQSILNDVSEYAIMAQTGHKKSDTLKKYIRETNKWKNNAASKLGL